MEKPKGFGAKGVYPELKGKKRKMAEMLVSPDVEKSVSEICREVGVSRQTFYNWQNDPSFKGYVEFLVDSFTDSELPRAWKSLVKKVDTGNVEAIKLFFTLKDKYTEKLTLGGELGVKIEDLI